MAPAAVVLFGFPSTTKFDDPGLKFDPGFLAKATSPIVALDMVIGMLGPDLDPVQEQLFELGARHRAYGCVPSHWLVVGDALFYVLTQALGDTFDGPTQQSWTILFNFMGYHMIQGLIASGGPDWDAC